MIGTYKQGELWIEGQRHTPCSEVCYSDKHTVMDGHLIPANSQFVALNKTPNYAITPAKSESLLIAYVLLRNEHVAPYQRALLTKHAFPGPAFAQAIRGYFDEIEYAKAPAFWSQLIGPVQFHHGFASVSDKEVSPDGRHQNANAPPEVTKPLDRSLLDVQDKIPEGNASAVAIMQYVSSKLQIMLIGRDLCQHQLMWDAKHSIWRLVFAFLPGFCTRLPTFFNIPPPAWNCSSKLPHSVASSVTLTPSIKPSARPFGKNVESQKGFLHLSHDDADSSNQPTLVQAVMQNFTPKQETAAIMPRSWWPGSSDQSRMSAGQPHLARLMQAHRQQSLAPMSETSVDQADSQHGQEPWKPPDGYQSSTSTQRQADAARDDQLTQEKAMDEETYDEYWYTMYGELYWACPCLLSNQQHDFLAILFVHLACKTIESIRLQCFAQTYIAFSRCHKAEWGGVSRTTAELSPWPNTSHHVTRSRFECKPSIIEKGVDSMTCTWIGLLLNASE